MNSNCCGGYGSSYGCGGGCGGSDEVSLKCLIVVRQRLQVLLINFRTACIRPIASSTAFIRRSPSHHNTAQRSIQPRSDCRGLLLGVGDGMGAAEVRESVGS